MADFGKRKREEQNQIDSLTGISTIKLAIGFCAAGLAAAMFLTPLLDIGSERFALSQRAAISGPVDRTVTGAIEKAKTVRRYTIRRSVMQKDPSRPCYIFEDGTMEGGC